jgi:hypothetical protein
MGGGQNPILEFTFSWCGFIVFAVIPLGCLEIELITLTPFVGERNLFNEIAQVRKECFSFFFNWRYNSAIPFKA